MTSSSKFRFIVVAKDDKFALKEEEIKAVGESTDVVFVKDNNVGLPELYNKYLDDDDALKYDYNVFMHADVWLDVQDLALHLDSVAGKYDLIGLCGCSKISVSQTPLNWFCGSRPFPQDRWGCVTHGELGNQTAYFSMHSPEILDHEVSCIDGLCIIFTKKAVEAKLRFDEQFKFNCYDTQISFEAVMSKHLKVGVVVQRELKHFSVGKSILSEDFLQDEVKLRTKYSLGFPEGSQVKAIAEKSALAKLS